MWLRCVEACPAGCVQVAVVDDAAALRRLPLHQSECLARAEEDGGQVDIEHSAGSRGGREAARARQRVEGRRLAPVETGRLSRRAQAAGGDLLLKLIPTNLGRSRRISPPLLHRQLVQGQSRGA